MKGSTDMKKAYCFAAVVVLALSVTAIPVSHAQTSGMGGMGSMGADKKSEAKSHKAAGTVTIAHGPIRSINWPAMSMTFTVKDKALLGKLAPEKKVEFEFVQQGSDYVITSAK